MAEPKSPGARLLMWQERIGALVDEIEKERMVVNVHYVPKGRSVTGAMHVVAVWPVDQWTHFYERGGRERLIGDAEALAARAEREAIESRFDKVTATLEELRGLLRGNAGVALGAPAQLAAQIRELPARFPEKIITHRDNRSWWLSGFEAAREQAAKLADEAGVKEGANGK